MRALAIGIVCIATWSAYADEIASVVRELPQARMPAPNRIVSGGIDASHMNVLRRAGIRHIVDLRPPEEAPDFDEAQAAAEQGIEHHSIPIRGPESLTLERVHEFDRILQEIGDEPALLHCASGNRVGALIALREAWLYGRPVEDALATGRAWGMTKLEPAVRSLLERPSAPSPNPEPGR